MNSIQRTSSVLRQIAIASLGAASLWTVSMAHAVIAPSTPAVLAGLQATVRTPVSSDASPVDNAPFLVAPDCGSVQCHRNRGNGARFGKSRPEREPETLPAQCPGGCSRTGLAVSFRAAPASLRIAGGGCRGTCMSRLPPVKFDEPHPAFVKCMPYPAPLHASPACGAGLRGPIEPATAEHSPLRLAGGDPTTVRDSPGPRLRPRG